MLGTGLPEGEGMSLRMTVSRSKVGAGKEED
jgi:hypothetical protein